MPVKKRPISVLVIHGPNLNLLGKREPDVYGRVTIGAIDKALLRHAKDIGVDVVIKQSNHEGEIVELIQDAGKDRDAIIINPAAYTHTSVAIRDAISAVDLPVVEVHLSNIYGREEFRHTSLIAPVAKGQIAGFGMTSYLLALDAVRSICGR